MFKRSHAILLLSCVLLCACPKREAATETSTSAAETTSTDTTGLNPSKPRAEHALSTVNRFTPFGFLPTFQPAPPPVVACGGAEQDFTVEVIFTGLCTFIDNNVISSTVLQPIDPATYTPQKMTVVIPDVRAGRPYMVPKFKPQMIHQHIPYIGFDSQYYCGASNAPLRFDPAVVGATPVTGGPYYFYPLHGEEVRWDSAFLSKGTNPSPPDYTMSFGTDRMCPTASTIGSLYWMPRITDAGGAGHTLNPLYLDPAPTADIAARVPLDVGMLRACPRTKIHWKYGTTGPSGTIDQVLAQEIVYTIKGRGATFTLTLHPFNNSGDQTLVLHPVNNKIELRIANIPPQFIQPNPAPIRPAPDKFDHHFAIYHEALLPAIAPDDRLIPFFVSMCANAAACRPVQFSSPVPPPGAPPAPPPVVVIAGVTHPSAESLNCPPDHVP